jgi:hypothetical protein
MIDGVLVEWIKGKRREEQREKKKKNLSKDGV